MSLIKHVSSMGEFNAFLAQKTKLSVVDFFATWCGPCKQIAPYFAKMSESFPKVNFIKVDVDQAQDIAQKYQIRAMPTFAFFLNGNKVDSVEGADVQRVQSLVEKYSKMAGPSPIPSDEELHNMSAKQLLTLMSDHNISSAGLPEKSDLIAELSKARK